MKKWELVRICTSDCRRYSDKAIRCFRERGRESISRSSFGLARPRSNPDSDEDELPVYGGGSPLTSSGRRPGSTTGSGLGLLGERLTVANESGESALGCRPSRVGDRRQVTGGGIQLNSIGSDPSVRPLVTIRPAWTLVRGSGPCITSITWGASNPDQPIF